MMRILVHIGITRLLNVDDLCTIVFYCVHSVNWKCGVFSGRCNTY